MTDFATAVHIKISHSSKLKLVNFIRFKCYNLSSSSQLLLLFLSKIHKMYCFSF